MKRKILMTPGPSPVPSFIRESLAKEMIHHRTAEFQEILGEVHDGLKKVFCTNNPVLIISSSGTGAMEAAVSNLFSSGDKVVTICGGKFGERWGEIAKSFQLEVIEMNVPWGSAPNAEELDELLSKNQDAKGVLTTLCETSTATVYDIKEIAKVVKGKSMLLAVDAVSGLGQDFIDIDNWGIDAVVSGSQKGFMLPPGLGFISLSAQAQKAAETSNLPKYYFNLKKALKSHAKNDTPFTPAVSLIVALREALNSINKEGIVNRCQRYKKMAYAAREAAKSLNLSLFSKSPSNSVTAINAPVGIKSSGLVKSLRSDYGLSIAGGQAEAKDKIFRIAHMGWINEQDLIGCFSLLEKVLKDAGHKFNIGASLMKLEEVFYG